MLSDRDLERLRGAVAAATFAERYDLGAEVAAGGMGRIHAATERASGRRVAVKLLPRAGGDADRFEAEVAILERLAHPAIVAYVGHGTTDAGERYLAMAWLDGDTVAARLARPPPLPIADAVAIGARVARAVAYAHAEGVVHRDLKPGNVVLVGGDPAAATVIDFGIAKAAAADRRLTRTGQLVGTPGYMAPEQAMGHTDVDGRVDLFALGCLLYECVAGAPPFEDPEVMVSLARLLLHDPPPIAATRPQVPARLDALIAALLAKQPERRLADPVVVADELDAIGAALAAGDTDALAATPIAPRPPQPPRPSRRRWWIAAGATAVAAALAAAVITIAVGRRDDRTPAPAPVPAPAMCTDTDLSGCEALCTAGTTPEACRTLGVALIYGRHGVSVDVERGRALLDRGCTAGATAACVSLGQHLRTWILQHPTAGTAADWLAPLDRGCTGGSAVACEMLAKGYDGAYRVEGVDSPASVAVDRGRATAYFERACALARGPACVTLAARLRGGIGAAADPARADQVLRDACSAGHTPACDRHAR